MKYDIERVVENGRTKYKMHKDDMWKFNKLDQRISKRYVLEYVSDPKIWDNICAEKYRDPWEYYTVKEFEGLWDSIEMYLNYLFCENVFDVKLYCETLLDDNVVLEETMEFDSSFFHEFRKMMFKKEVERRDAALDAMEELKKENESMKAFIKKYNVEQTYKEFLISK